MDTLLTTKFHMPLLPDETVTRPRLSNKLPTTTKVPLICAPAGFGKTTLASAWLSRRKAPTAWLSLDENDNEAHRFFSYLFTALDRIEPGVAEKALELLQTPNPSIIIPATQLLDTL